MFGILSMVVAIVGLLLGWMVAKWLGIVITAISIVLAIVGLVKKSSSAGAAVAGKTLAVIGLIVAIAAFLSSFFVDAETVRWFLENFGKGA